MAMVMLWAVPWTFLGICMGVVGLLTGGGMQRVGRVLEFHGGLLAWLLTRAPIAGGACALTLGHTVLARTAGDLDRTRRHELVHVAQYERWGLLFVPAYLGLLGLALAPRTRSLLGQSVRARGVPRRVRERVESQNQSPQ